MKRYPLTSTQQSIWTAQHIFPNTALYNVGGYACIKGKIDYASMKQAISWLMQSSDIFRLCFENVAGVPIQHFRAASSYELMYLDFSAYADPDQECRAWMEQNFGECIQIDGPLFQTTLLDGEKDQYWYVKIHHLIGDGYTLSLLFNKVASLYSALCQDKAFPASVDFSYASFLEANTRYKASGRFTEDKLFWLDQYQQIPEKPTLGKVTARDVPYEVDRVEHVIAAKLFQRIKLFCAQNHCTEYHFFLAILYIFCSRITEQNSFVIGLPVFNRSSGAGKQTLGTHINVLPFKFGDYSATTFKETLDRIQKLLLTCYKHHNFTAYDLHTALQLTGTLFNISFSYQKNPYQSQFHDLEIEIHYLKARYQFEDLVIHLIEYNDQWEVKLLLDYNKDKFARGVIEKWLDSLLYLVETVLESPDTAIKRIPLLSPVEEKRLLALGTRTAATQPSHQHVHGMFEEQVKKTPDHIAIASQDRTLTYRQLHQITNHLAADLQEKGVSTNGVAAIIATCSESFVIGVLGVLKAGAAYVPIDPQLPSARILYCIEDSQSRIVLVEQAIRHLIEDAFGGFSSKPLLPIPTEWDSVEEGAWLELPVARASDLAYIMYTSGTTGKPKGVMVSHQNLVNYCLFAAQQYVREEKLSFPLFTSVSYDLGVTALFTPLITGNTILVYPDASLSQDMILEKIIGEKQAGIIKLTPSHLKLIANKIDKNSAVKRLIVGGEELQTGLAAEIVRQSEGSIEIYNEYGPTETTVGCTVHKFDPTTDKAATVPIGVPISNTQVYILDTDRQIVPVGVIGELYIAGEGVAKGYVNERTLTEEKFVPHSFSPTSQKMYKTGDLASWSPDGTIHFLGRVDEQVKIRGMRVETVEIEQLLLAHPSIQETKVVVREQRDEKYLCAYYVADQELSSQELRAYLGQNLDYRSMPHYFVLLNHIPLTANGKVDRNALPAPGTQSVELYKAPATPLEAYVVKVWQELLKVDTIGIRDNFFDLGGDSIKAVQIISRLTSAGITSTVRAILTEQTIEQLCLSGKIAYKDNGYAQEAASGSKGLTPIDQWFFSQHFHTPAYYNQSVLLQWKGAMDVVRVEHVWQQIIQHHDALRLNVDPATNSLFFNSQAELPFSVSLFDISTLSDAEKTKELERIGMQVKSTFNVNKDGLMRVACIQWDEDMSKLLLTAHHVAIDGMSWRILLHDFYTCYSALQHNQIPVLPKKTASLHDWYQQLMHHYSFTKALKEKPYWEAIQQTAFQLPSDWETNDWRVVNQEKIQRKLGFTTTQVLLKGAATSYRMDSAVLLLTALAQTLHQWIPTTACLIEVENHGRYIDDCDVSRTVGWFTAMFPVKLSLAANQPIREQILAVKAYWNAIPAHGLGYGMLTYTYDQLGPKKQRSKVRFNYLGQFTTEANNDLFSYADELTGTDIAPENEMTAELELICMIIEGDLRVELNYNATQFKSSTTHSFLDQYLEQITRITQHLESDSIHFIPSDFDTVDIGQDDLEAMFN